MPSNLPPFIDLAWFKKAKPNANRIDCSVQHRFEVFEYDGLRWISMADGAVQSMLFVEDHSYPVLHYIKALLCSLVFVDQPKKLLNLGLGSGAIERYLASHHPDIAVTSIEPEIDMITLSKACFYLDKNHQVRNLPAEVFLQSNQQQFDLIICDIHTPPERLNPIESVTFLQNLTDAISPQGVVSINFLADNEAQIVNMLVQLRQIFKQVTLLDLAKQQNIVFYCSNAHFPEQSDLTEKAAMPLYNQLQAESILSELIWLPK
jgi:spermidine synthase